MQIPQGRVSEKKGGEQRSWGAEVRRKKRELIMFGYKAQEIPPKISFIPPRVKENCLLPPQLPSSPSSPATSAPPLPQLPLPKKTRIQAPGFIRGKNKDSIIIPSPWL